MLLPDLEAVRRALFAHPGVKAVDAGPTLFQTSDGGIGVEANLTVASPDVDQRTVTTTIEMVLQQQWSIAEVRLFFKFAGAEPSDRSVFGAPLEKK